LDRTAALVVRVWIEDDEGFRARLTGSAHDEDEDTAEQITVAVAATPGDVIDAVRAWLDEFLARATGTD
jgi:hypothetical protein